MLGLFQVDPAVTILGPDPQTAGIWFSALWSHVGDLTASGAPLSDSAADACIDVLGEIPVSLGAHGGRVQGSASSGSGSGAAGEVTFPLRTVTLPGNLAGRDDHGP